MDTNGFMNVDGFSVVGQEELERVNGGIGGTEPIIVADGGFNRPPPPDRPKGGGIGDIIHNL
ncbi:MAG: hypothetical protein FWD94_04160 [Treponema sp.]|nr:hypothetical protein [Treponema sp.]